MSFLKTSRIAVSVISSNVRFLSTKSVLAQSQSQANPDSFVRITEVGPRDGLQNEKTVPLTTKLELIEKLATTGLRSIEAGSFVSPKWVPQMADSFQIFEHILKNPPDSEKKVSYSFLVPNKRGIENALCLLQSHSPTLQHPIIEFAIFASASETFSHKNLNCSIATSLERFKVVITAARAANHRIRAYISVVLGCPFEGVVKPSAVTSLATNLLSMGADTIDLGDTTGMGTAPTTMELLRSLRAAGIRNEDLTMHFHDTYGMALVNTAVSLEQGVRSFDGSIGGLGGCPYSPGATGNVPTEDLVYFLESLGMKTGVDLDALASVGEWVGKVVGKTDGSRVGRALLGKRI